MPDAAPAERPRWWWRPKRAVAWLDEQRAKPPSKQQLREDAWMDLMGEAHERSVMPCLDCEAGEPHACQREWWRQQLAHHSGKTCDDTECMCHVAAALDVEAALLRPASYLDAVLPR